jgi:hypothetical protein
VDAQLHGSITNRLICKSGINNHKITSNMKRILAGVACLALCVGAIAQGTVNFNNSPATVGGTGAPIFDVDGVTRLEGTGYLAQLFAGPDANSLSAWGDALSFRTGTGAGFFNTTGVNTSRTILTVAPGAVATIEVRAWETAGGTYTSYDAAFAGGAAHGRSDIFTVATGGGGTPPAPAANLVGLTSFSLVPEPSTYALLALGAAALFLRRRK